MSFDDYEYSEVIRGELLVVEDLGDADYAYAEELDSYEVRRHGSRLGRFDDWSSVENFLEDV